MALHRKKNRKKKTHTARVEGNSSYNLGLACFFDVNCLEIITSWIS